MAQIVSSAISTPEQVAQDDVLFRLLRTQGQIPTPKDTALRHEAVGRLYQMLADFTRGTPEIQLQLLTFGSFRLNVFTPASDIDALVVTNCAFTDTMFFHDLKHYLEVHQCSEVVSVQEAFMPLLSFECMTVKFDLLWCNTLTGTIPSNLLYDDILVNRLPSPHDRALNGPRVTEKLHSIVPNRPQDFRLALRFVRHWAKVRGLYGNVFGFPGGVAWAIMLAKVCLLFPRACASVLVRKFFRMWSIWNFQAPVALCEVVEPPVATKTSWLRGHNSNVMVVLTPCYPSGNTTYNVGVAQMRRLRREFGRANRLGADFGRIVNKVDFCGLYKHYVVVSARTGCPAFRGFLESKVRHLVASMDRDHMVNVNVWPAPLKHAYHLGLEVDSGSGKLLDLRAYVTHFKQLLACSRPEGLDEQAVVIEYKSRRELRHTKRKRTSRTSA